MSNDKLITTMVTQWNSVDRPYRAEIRVDGYSVSKSFHSTRESAFVWCEQMKEQKLKELGQ